MGYARAGFEVVGVDIEPQPDYPFEFVQGDALEYLAEHGDEFDAIHASPPCTEHTTLTRGIAGRDDPTGTADLLGRTLDALADTPHGMWAVENVMGARMPTDMVLCGNMFGIRTYRHRRFSIGPGLLMLNVPPHPRHTVPAARKQRQAAWDDGWNLTVTGNATKAGRIHHAILAEALGVDWITGDGLNLMIPPAYTQFIGRQMLEELAA
jgi:DNA (cytosine-5)-methyltransferase 1